MQAQIESVTRAILAYGSFPIDHPDSGVEIVDVAESEALKFSQPGDKFLQLDGTVRVDTTRLDQMQAEEAARQQAASQQAAALKAQTIGAFTTEFHSLSTAAGPLTAALMLHQSMEVARQSFGIVIETSDLPADLQQGLASLPA